MLLYSIALDDPTLTGWYEGVHRRLWWQGAHTLLVESAQNDQFGVHSLTDSAQDADIIVFAEMGGHGMFAEAARHHPYVRQYREKCFLFDSGDYALPFLPGLYASLRRRYLDPTRTRTGYYLNVDANPFVHPRPLDENPRYMGCFVGSLENHPVRLALAKLVCKRLLIEDASSYALTMLSAGEDHERNTFWSHYAEAMAASAFSLCPRGRGPGSIRLFESMCMGRCPVILSDEWVYPERVAWPDCSIHVAEKDVAKLPEILEKNQDRAGTMGARARKEWEKFYAPNVRFHWLVEDCMQMMKMRRRSEAVAGQLVWLHLLKYDNFRRYLTSKRQFYLRYGRIVL